MSITPVRPAAAIDRARRALLRRAGLLAGAGTAAPVALNLSLMGEAAAAAGAGGYRALVCVFLYGGNDHANTVVPADDAHHASYARLRGPLATPRAALHATTLAPAAPLPGGLRLALAPQLAPLLPLWNAGDMAVQLNVGPLVLPTNVAQYHARAVPLPPKLMSHNDQQSIWQSALAEGARTGWGGRIGDLLLSGNGGSLFTCTSVTGNAVFLAGGTAVQYQLGSHGAVPIRGIEQSLYGSLAAQAALRQLVTLPHAHLFGNAYTAITRRSIDAELRVTEALGALPALDTAFPADPLAMQLRTVARMIAARGAFGVTRQVFFVSHGGYDLHNGLLETHPVLLSQLGRALRAFYDATVELGVAQQVTTFTASDFGRALTCNGDGSDHGWGAHHLMIGGAVKGRSFYGSAPAIAVNGPDDIGQGRLLPTTSVDQFSATLAAWLGVPDTDLVDVAPNLPNFSARKLGFL
ncbi:MAG TPA: DUF1501 domain-containing protein [Aquabacterium sp.]|nr:DUF1501 domain-containing protein [Aquabacterium sp.]